MGEGLLECSRVQEEIREVMVDLRVQRVANESGKFRGWGDDSTAGSSLAADSLVGRLIRSTWWQMTVEVWWHNSFLAKHPPARVPPPTKPPPHLSSQVEPP